MGGKADISGTPAFLRTSIGASSLQSDTFQAKLIHAEEEEHFPWQSD